MSVTPNRNCDEATLNAAHIPRYNIDVNIIFCDVSESPEPRKCIPDIIPIPIANVNIITNPAASFQNPKVWLDASGIFIEPFAEFVPY